MANIKFTGQDIESSSIQPKLLKLKTLMDERKEIWHKISFDKRKVWVTSNADPIMDIAWDVYKYLDTNFFGRYYNDTSKS